MLLLIDIGNTNITTCLYGDGHVQDIMRIETDPDMRDVNIYARMFSKFIDENQPADPVGSALCSVVPELSQPVMDAVEDTCGIKTLNVSTGLKTGLNFLIDNPDKLGADRIANAVAARRLYNGELIVIDFGTATTFCVINRAGDYLGGAIMPGPGMAANVLSDKTSKLPDVTLKAPENIPGKNTVDNILIGILLGQAGAAERIIKDITADFNKDITVIATGGFAEFITPYMKVDVVNPLLTIEGLRFIYEMNKDE